MAIKDLKIHMPTVYGSSYEDAGKTVLQKYGTAYQTKLQWAWGNWKFRGLTAAQFETLPVTNAEMNDAAWTQEAPNNLASGFQNTYTKVIPPKGKFPLLATMNIARGGMVGEGCFSYNGSGGDQGQVATEFVMGDSWIGAGTEQRVFETPNANYVGNLGYNECPEIVGVRLTCTVKKAGVTRIGWYLKKLGSTSWLNQLQANGFNKGFVLIDGVPVLIGTVRAFEANAGISFEGTWGADITVLKLETDGANRSFQVINTGEGNGGGTIRIGLKVEDGVTAGVPIANTIAGWVEGQYDIEVWGNFSYQNGAKPEHLFVINPIINGGAKQSSRLGISGKGYGYGKLIKNNLTGSEWSGPGDYAAFKVEHYAVNDTLTTGCPTISKVGTAPPPVDPPVPPPSGVKFSGGPYTITSPTFDVPVNIAGVTRVKLTGFKPTALSWGRVLGVGSTGGLQLGPDGSWYWAGAKLNIAKAVLNVSADWDIILPSAGNITTLWNATATDGGAQLCTCTKLELS